MLGMQISVILKCSQDDLKGMNMNIKITMEMKYFSSEKNAMWRDKNSARCLATQNLPAYHRISDDGGDRHVIKETPLFFCKLEVYSSQIL